MFARYFVESGIQFDFFEYCVDPSEREPSEIESKLTQKASKGYSEHNAPLHFAKYRRIVETVVVNPELGVIAGGYFTKYTDQRTQTVDVYILFKGKENPPSDELLNSMIRSEFKNMPFENSSQLNVLREKRLVISIPDFRKSFYCCVRIIRAATIHEVLDTFNWHPAQIGYSYSLNRLVFDSWYLTGGPMYNGSTALKSRYAEKRFTDEMEKILPHLYEVKCADASDEGSHA